MKVESTKMDSKPEPGALTPPFADDGRELRLGLSPWVTIPRFLFRCGLKRGVGTVMRTMARRRPRLQMLPVRLNDGRILHLDLREPMSMAYLLRGETWGEAGETALVRSLMRAGECAIDIGANVGWYCTMLSELVGPRGRVFAFEPDTRAERMLQASAQRYPQLQIIRAAVCDHEGEGSFHITADGVSGSLHDVPEVVGTETCPVTTLDAVLTAAGGPPVTFVKCDAEGAEAAILRGAVRTLFQSPRPPAWMMEVSVSTAQRFGSHPDELFQFFAAFAGAGYHGYRIDSRTGRLEPPPQTIAHYYNCLFLPSWLEERVASHRTL